MVISFVLLLTPLCLIVAGKVNHGVKLLGRMMRHRNVLMCGFGAFGFYMMLRFSVSGEMNETHRPDFTNNKDWFSIKIITSGRVNDRKEELKKDSYSRAMKELCIVLGIPTRHYVHLGRVLGPALMEYYELDNALIKELGNWNPDVRQSRYSTKLPMKGIRAMAGFTEEKDPHWNPRVACEVPEELTQQIFPWIEEELEKVLEANRVDKKERYTAMAFLKVLKELRAIIIQDAATILIEHPERKEHFLFGHFEIFKTTEFKVRTVVFYL